MNSTENPQIVMKVSVADTFRAIEPGASVTFDCRQLGPLNSAQSVASRLNANAGRKEYVVTTEDNGATYTVTRNAQPS